MITRVEMDGFESFPDFTLDVPPLLALVGPNAGGVPAGKRWCARTVEALKGLHYL